MSEFLHLSIVTPEGRIFDGDVKSVTLPGSEGEFGVLPGHADTVSLLSAGAIEIEREKAASTDIVAVDWGYTKVDEQHVDVLAHGAVMISGDTESEIAKAISDAKDLLRDAGDDNIAMGAVMSRIESAGKSRL